MNLHTGKKLRERVQKISLGLCCLNSVAVLRESSLQTVVDCLGEMIIKLLEVLLLHFLLDAIVLK